MDMKALEHALAVAHRWAVGFEVILVTGISGQYVAPWLLEKMGWQRFVRGVKIACAIAVVGGLLGNYEIGKGQFRYLQLFERAVDTKLASARQETAAAKITAADSLLRVKEAETLAAKSQQQAIEAMRFGEIEHRARLQFEAANGARRIAPESQKKSAENLRYFYGEPSLITFRSGDLEASNFSIDIDQMLVQSHWNVQGRQETPMIVSLTGDPLEVNQRSGVSVQATRDPKAGRALVNHLKSNGVEAHFVAAPAANLGGPMVDVTVEHRPAGAAHDVAVRIDGNRTKAGE